MTEEKRCTTCGLTKCFDDFPKSSRAKDGRKSECKLCHKERNIRLYYANKERYQEVSNAYKRNNPKVGKARKQRTRKIAKLLPCEWQREHIEELEHRFSSACAISGSSDIHYDHFIPLATGHGGTHIRNIIPLASSLNTSKQAKNPFEWIQTQPESMADDFSRVVAYLAELNGLSVDDYKEYVTWCFDNPRDITQIEADRRYSVDIWSSIRRKTS